MKNILKYTAVILALMAFAGCDEEPTDALEEIIKEDKGYLPVIATFTLTDPDDPVITPGQTTTFDLRYWSEGVVSEIEFWMIRDEAETLIEEYDYTPAYSDVTRT